MNLYISTDSSPAGIIRWERDGPDDEPDNVEDLVRPHVAIEDEPDEDGRLWMCARRRWHVREDDGRELCPMPFGYSPMQSDRENPWFESVVPGSVDGDDKGCCTDLPVIVRAGQRSPVKDYNSPYTVGQNG